MVVSKKESKKDKVYDIVDAIEKFGFYQIVQYFYACLPAVIVTMINVNYIFVAGDMKYRCRVPECDTPESTVDRPPWWPDTVTDRCTGPVLNDNIISNFTCTNTSFVDSVQACTEWIYESHDTIIADLNLACQPWKINLIGTIHNVGLLSSMIIAGWLSDRFGRKPTLIVCAVSSCLGSFKTLATSYTPYVLIEFFEAALCGGTYAAGMVIMIEISGKKNRLLAGVLFAYAIYLGETIFAALAIVVPYWKHLIYIIYLPTVVFISYIFLIRESPRWQIFNGNIEDAKKTIRIISRMNKIKINLSELKDIDEAKLKEKFNMGEVETGDSYKDIFTSKEIWKRLLVSCVCRFTVSFVYYGLMVNSVLLPGNKHTNFMLSTIMSFPGELISLYLMNKIGRKLPLLGGFLVCGVLCVGSGYVPESLTWLKVTMFLLGKMIVSLCFTGSVTYNMELFPTSARGTLLGICAFASGVGEMLSPMTPLLTVVSPSLPAIFFGAFSVISGLLVLLTPETRDLPLMDTVEQVETSARNAKNKKSAVA